MHCLIADNVCTHATGIEDATAPFTSGIYLHCASYCTIVGNVTSGMSQGFGCYDVCEDNFIVGNLFRFRGDVSSGTAGISLATSTVAKNTVLGNAIAALAGDVAVDQRVRVSEHLSLQSISQEARPAHDLSRLRHRRHQTCFAVTTTTRPV
ncbi:MAG: right-handed parallel beta-helix repeat-containing protein [Planctomycetaceae bacterium]